MSKKNREKRKGIVYSTDPDFTYEYENESEPSTLPKHEQILKISLDRKQRKGKTVTLVEGFTGKAIDLEKLARELKKHCGTGGNFKDNIIIIQGDMQSKVVDFLSKKGYKLKK